MTEKDPKTTTYIIVGGPHSRIENGEKKRYLPGDAIELTEIEARTIRNKILSLAEFKERVAGHEKSEAFAKEAEEILNPPEIPRDPENLARAEQIERMKKPGRIGID